MGYNWHGIAWGAECAWNASETSIEDFNRRIGAVLFAEKDDHFGQAIPLLAKTYKVIGLDGDADRRFWKFDDGMLPAVRDAARARAKNLLDVIDPALSQLQAARAEAKINTDKLDCVIMAAERIKLLATRIPDFIDATDLYEQAMNQSARPDEQTRLLEGAKRIVTRIRDEHIASREKFKAMWLNENKPYLLDVNLKKYDDLIGQYNSVLAGFDKASKAVEAKQPFPSHVRYRAGEY